MHLTVYQECQNGKHSECPREHLVPEGVYGGSRCICQCHSPKPKYSPRLAAMLIGATMAMGVPRAVKGPKDGDKDDILIRLHCDCGHEFTCGGQIRKTGTVNCPKCGTVCHPSEQVKFLTGISSQLPDEGNEKQLTGRIENDFTHPLLSGFTSAHSNPTFAHIDHLTQCVNAQQTQLSELRAECERLKAGGCARDQRTTQFCAEAVALQKENERLNAEWDRYRKDAGDILVDRLNDIQTLRARVVALEKALTEIAAMTTPSKVGGVGTGYTIAASCGSLARAALNPTISEGKE
jgi:hypothetical protein